jgi:geranylgeranyl diphosphate synthase type II
MFLKIKDYLQTKKSFFENNIDKYFPQIAPEMAVLENAIRYSLLAGGKRIRPVLAFAVAEMMNYPVEKVLPVALAIEMIHTYSLIHDDLPCMDNDDFRRGKPTCHKAFSEETAVLAGDGLLTEAFKVVADFPKDEKLLKGKLTLISKLAEAAGVNGMVGGQIMDMKHPREGGYEYLKLLHKRKTGAMIKISCTAPLYLFDANESDVKNIGDFGEKIGLLFQVVDDILDKTATFNQLGKTPGKDSEQQKLTYVSLFGLEKSKTIAEKLVKEACTVIGVYKNSRYLQEIAKYIYKRTN